MTYRLEEMSLELIDALVPLMPRIKQHDKSLEDQLRRAASSIGLNLAEAAGSARETQHALRQAIAWRYVTARDAERALGLVRRLMDVLWRITRG